MAHAKSQKLEHKSVDLTRFKGSDSGNGSFEGYGNDFGVLDSYGDISLPGAYADTIEQFKNTGWTTTDHTWGVKDELGIVTDAHEDETGLFIHSEYHPTDDAQQIRQKVNFRLANGKAVRLSIGYIAQKFRYVSSKEAVKYLKDANDPDALAQLKSTPRVRLLEKIELFEVSIVSVPAEPQARVTGAKSAKSKTAVKRMAEDLKSVQTMHDLSAKMLGLKCWGKSAVELDLAESKMTASEKEYCKELHAETVKMGGQCKDADAGSDSGSGSDTGGDTSSADTADSAKRLWPLDIKGIFEEALAERVNSLYVLFDVLCSVIYQITYADEVAESTGAGEIDVEGMLGEALAEFSQRVIDLVVEEDEEEDADEDAGEISTTRSNVIIAGKAGALAALTFADHSEAALAVVKGLAERALSIQRLRAKEGRTISAANARRMRSAQDRIKEAQDSMQTVHDDMDDLINLAEPAKLSPVRLLVMQLEAATAGVL